MNTKSMFLEFINITEILYNWYVIVLIKLYQNLAYGGNEMYTL